MAEDEYFVADEETEALTAEGATVLGPVGRADEALALARSEERIDGALLDANLDGTLIWPVVDVLLERGVPLVLLSGYDPRSIPAAYAGLTRHEKPAEMRTVLRSLRRAIKPG